MNKYLMFYENEDIVLEVTSQWSDAMLRQMLNNGILEGAKYLDDCETGAGEINSIVATFIV